MVKKTELDILREQEAKKDAVKYFKADDLSANITEKMKEKNWKDKQLAAAIGDPCTERMVGHWRRGETDIKLYFIYRMCSEDVFDCSIEELISMPGKDTDPAATQRYTKLSMKAIKYLHDLRADQRDVLNSILNHESGLDEILDSIVKAQRFPYRMKDIEREVDSGINYYKKEANNAFQREAIPSDIAQLQEMRETISNSINVLQLQEWKQENLLKEIRIIFDSILKNLVPPAKSDKYPDPEATKHDVLNDQVQKILYDF